jgi:hypothetical protein
MPARKPPKARRTGQRATDASEFAGALRLTGVSLDKRTLTLLRQIGDGNVSRGIRAITRRFGVVMLQNKSIVETSDT